MPWSEVSISVDHDGVAEVELTLEEQGALAVTLSDDADDPVLEPGPGATPLWPSVEVRGLFGDDISKTAVTEALQQQAKILRPDRIRWRTIEDRDWERTWLDRFRPMRFGSHLWIVPTGTAIPPDPANVEIRLDPGLAFGTGTHATTALCLEWLDGQDVRGKRVIDYGCGSGILGIAAAMKGASEVIGIDNDPQALEATRSNAQRNGVSDRVSCRLPDDGGEETADILLANILAGPLIELAPRLAARTRPGGVIVLSGILEEQEAEVTEAYRPFCADISAAALDGWLRLVGARR